MGCCKGMNSENQNTENKNSRKNESLMSDLTIGLIIAIGLGIIVLFR